MTHKPNWHPMVTNFIQLAKLHGIDCTSTLWLRMPDHQHLYLCTTLKTHDCISCPVNASAMPLPEVISPHACVRYIDQAT